jgi:hypothetical protein
LLISLFKKELDSLVDSCMRLFTVAPNKRQACDWIVEGFDTPYGTAQQYNEGNNPVHLWYSIYRCGVFVEIFVEKYWLIVVLFLYFDES